MTLRNEKTRRTFALPVSGGQPSVTLDRIAAVDKHIEAVIGTQLRTIYDDILNEPIPQRFIDLLDNLSKEAEQ